MTKNMTHKRQLKGKKGVSITFSLDMNLMVTKNNDSLTFLAPNSQIRAVRFFMTKQMQTISLSKRQLSQHPQWIQF